MIIRTKARERALQTEIDRLRADLAAERAHTKSWADDCRALQAGGGVIETQRSITNWANETFGEASSCARVAARANEEMAELLRALTADFIDPAKAAEEAADVVIVLFRVAELCGRNLLEEVDRKMSVNRGRKWKLSGDGHGYHVRTED